MKIALIGASGNIGAKIRDEALSRGHSVTGIVRHPEKLPAREGLTAVAGDVSDTQGLVAQIKGHDAVVSSVTFSAFDPATLLGAIKQAGVKRYIAVGGAASLRAQDGRLALEKMREQNVPWFSEAEKGVAFLETIKGETALDWTFICPSLLIEAGARTGVFRLGANDVLVDAKGESRISEEDYAVALVNELEKPAHIRQRFTVGY